MPNWIVMRRLAGLLALVCGPLSLIYLLALVVKWQELATSGELGEEIFLHLAAVLITGLLTLWKG